MEMIKNIFNNREIASIIWITLFVLYIFINKTTQKYLFAIFSNKILWQTIISSSVYTVAIISILYNFELWDVSMLKDTIIWLLTAVALLFSKLSKNDYNFMKLLKENIKINIIVEFIFNIYSFNLLLELILLPFISIIILIEEICKNKKEYIQFSKFLEKLLGIIGIIIIIFTIKNIINNYNDLNIIKNVRDIIFQPILTIIFIPCIYLWGLLIEIQNIYVHIKDKEYLENPKKIIFTIVIDNRFNLYRIRKFWQGNAFTMLDCNNIKEIEQILKDWRKDRR